MFRKMRRADRAMDEAQTEALLEKGEYGILASNGEGDRPYAVPYSYALHLGKLYIHGSGGESHTKNNIRSHPNVCFTVVGKTELLPEKFSTCYESVVVFGTAREVSDREKKQAALLALLEKYSPGFLEEGKRYIAAAIDATSVIEITPLHMTGKARRKDPEPETAD